MTGSVAIRYAVRSLRRNLRRSALSIVGVAIGVGIGLVALSWIRGEKTMIIGAAAAGGVGHLRIAPEGWADRRDTSMRLVGWESLLQQVRAMDGVRVATPRARVGGLLGLGTRSTHVTLTGVDPRTEPQALRYIREIQQGRYLEPGERGAVVLGRTHARRLDAQLDDELVVTAVDATGEMSSALLVVVGIVATGSRDVDATIAHVSLADVEQLSAREGAAEITILANDVYELDAMQERIEPLVHAPNVLLTWRQVAPDLTTGLESDGAFFDMAVLIILLVVLLGVASAQLTSVLERRKEFAVLSALGMRASVLVQIVLMEGIALGGLSALSALAWAGPLVWHLDRAGLDLSKLVSGEGGWAMGGVLFDPVFHPDFGLWIFAAALLLSMIATVTASLYPAWFAARTDPANALRLDR